MLNNNEGEQTTTKKKINEFPKHRIKQKKWTQKQHTSIIPFT